MPFNLSHGREFVDQPWERFTLQSHDGNGLQTLRVNLGNIFEQGGLETRSFQDVEDALPGVRFRTNPSEGFLERVFREGFSSEFCGKVTRSMSQP